MKVVCYPIRSADRFGRLFERSGGFATRYYAIAQVLKAPRHLKSSRSMCGEGQVTSQREVAIVIHNGSNAY